MTEQQYQSLVDYTKSLIQKHVGWGDLRAAKVDIGDVVGEVLLLCYEQGLSTELNGIRSTELYLIKKQIKGKVVDYIYKIWKPGNPVKTEMTSQEHRELVIYASKLINARELFIDPEELISEAFITLSGTKYSIEDFKDEMRKYANSEKARQRSVCEFQESPSKQTTWEDSRVCAKCNELLPIAAFRLRTLGIRPECKKCENERIAGYRRSMTERLNEIAGQKGIAAHLMRMRAIHAKGIRR